jgi:hypothetical protein
VRRRRRAGARITLRTVGRDEPPLSAALRAADGAADFSLCNPPFFAHAADAAGAGHRRARAACADELVTAGGEAGFVARLIDDSAALRGRVGWYSAMLGHRASLPPLAAAARRRGATAVHTAAFYQGQTVRWGLAWSFRPQPPPAPARRFLSRHPPHELRAAVARRLRAAGAAFAWRSDADGAGGGGAGGAEAAGGAEDRMVGRGEVCACVRE